MESDTPIDLLVSREWNGTKWHYPNIERMVEENKRLRAELAAALRALQKAHDAMVLAKTSHGCFLACDPPIDAWKHRCVDAHLGDAIRECGRDAEGGGMSDLTETDFPPLEPQPFVTEEGREIERLRAELAAERATTASLLRTIALIREAGGFTRDDLAALPGAVKAMREQRDAARRTLCEEWAKDGLPFDWKGRRGPMGMADLLKWDCYAEKEGGGA